MTPAGLFKVIEVLLDVLELYGVPAATKEMLVAGFTRVRLIAL
jgi:hypothetical protein